MRSAIIIVLIVCISIAYPKKLSQFTGIREHKKTIKSSPDQVVLDFYNWYLKKIYPYADKYDFASPDVKLTQDSIYQIVSQDQFEKLRKTGFFADDFFTHQSAIYNKCNIQLKKVKFKDVDKCGCSPAELVKTSDCDFLSYYAWIGGQGEAINNVKIHNTNTIGKISIVTAYLSAGDYLYSRPEITLTAQSGNWKIAKIELHY